MGEGKSKASRRPDTDKEYHDLSTFEERRPICQSFFIRRLALYFLGGESL